MSDGKIVIKTDLDNSGIKEGLSRLESITQKGLGAVVKTAAVATTAITAAGTAAVITGANFESAMSRVQAVSGATGKDFEALRKQAIELGASTAFSASEAAVGMENLASAGFEVSEIMDAMPGMLDLAASSGEDLASSADIAASTLRGFNLEASKASHVADVLAKNAADTNAAVSDTGEAMKYVAPVANAMGLEFEECTAAIGIMADAGIKGSQAGTSLRGSLSRLAKPTEAMTEVMAELGLEYYDAEGKMISLTEQTKMLSEKMAGLTEEERNNALITLYGQESLSGMLALIQAGPEKLGSLTESYKNCDGAAADMAETMQDNLKSAVEEFGGGLETLGIQIYDRIEKPLRQAVVAGTEGIDRLSDAFAKGGFKGAVSEAGEILEDFIDDLADSNKTVKSVVVPLKNLTKSAIDLGKKALPPVAKSFGLVVTNLDKFVPLAVAGYTAIKGYTVVTKASKALSALSSAWKIASINVDRYNVIQLACTMQGMRSTATLTAGQAAVGLLTGKVSLATAAQTAWNAVMNANPIGLVVTSVGALAAGLGIYKTMSNNATDASSRFTSKQKEIIENSEEAIENIREEAEARRESLNVATAEIDQAEDLWNELQKCVDVNGKVKEGYESRTKFITNELSDALGIEIELTNGVIRNYDELKNSIHDVIVAKQAEAVMDVMKTEYGNALKEQGDLASDLAKQYDALAASKKKVAELESELAKESGYTLMTLYNGNIVKQYSNRYYELKTELEKVNAELTTNQAAFDASSAAMKDNEDVISDYNLLLEASMSGSTETVENALARIQGGINTTMDASSEAALNQTKEIGEKLLDILHMQEEGVAEIQQSVIDGSAESMGIALNTISTSSESMKAYLEEAGQEGSLKMIKAMQDADLAGNMSMEAKSGMEAFIAAYDELYGETKKVGAESQQGFQAGLRSELNNTVNVAKQIANAAKKQLEVDTQACGRYFGNGFIKGIKGTAKNVGDAAASIAERALSSMKSKLDIHSPSKKSGKLGKFTGVGYVNELRKQAPEAQKAAEEVAKSALQGMDVGYQLGRMRAAMSTEKTLIGANMTNRVLHEFIMGNRSDFLNLGQRISELKNHIDNIKIQLQLEGKAYIDKKEAGYILAPEINHLLGEFTELEGR